MARLTVERDTYETRDKKEYYNYFVRGQVRGREVRAELAPKNKDFDGYELLDLIFDIAPTAELYIHDEESETASGSKSRYVDLPAYNFRDTGKLYWSIRKSFRAAGMLTRRPCVSLETPLTDNGEITLADTIAGADGFAELEEQENARAVLDMIAEQTQLTEKQRDQLTALAFGVALYRGIYAEEYRYAHTVNA